MADFSGFRIEDINKSCLDIFKAHWECLDNRNQQLWQCRPQERLLNACIFEKLVRFGSALFFAICANCMIRVSRRRYRGLQTMKFLSI